MEIESKDSVAPKKGNLLLWVAAFVAVVCVSGFVGYKFLLGANNTLEKKAEPVELKVVQESKIPAQLTQVKDEIEHSDLQFGQEFAPEKVEKAEEQKLDVTEKLTADLAKEIEQDALVEKKSEEKAAASIAKIEPKILELEKKNQNLLMFLSAQNISNAYHAADVKALKRELDFFKEVAGSDVEFQGKFDLLQYSLEGGLTSADELAIQLDAIAKSIENAQEKTFWENLQDSIFGLVKVTKLDEKAEGDYPKVLLAKQALKNKDFNEAIRLVDAIDKKHTKAWLDKAYKQQRVQESIGYLLEMTRKKLVQ